MIGSGLEDAAHRRRLLAPAAASRRGGRLGARGRHDPPRGAAHERGARRQAAGARRRAEPALAGAQPRRRASGSDARGGGGIRQAPARSLLRRRRPPQPPRDERPLVHRRRRAASVRTPVAAAGVGPRGRLAERGQDPAPRQRVTAAQRPGPAPPRPRSAAPRLRRAPRRSSACAAWAPGARSATRCSTRGSSPGSATRSASRRCFQARVSPWRLVEELDAGRARARRRRERARDEDLDRQGPAAAGDLPSEQHRRLSALRRPDRIARPGRRQPDRLLVSGAVRPRPFPATRGLDNRDTRPGWARNPSSCSTRVPLFAELSSDELSGSRSVAIPRSFPKGVRVFHEGDHSDACYIVRSGDLRVTREHSDGRAIALATLGPGDIFGELAMLDGGRPLGERRDALRRASCWRCRRPTSAACSPRTREITAKLIVALTRRLRETNERVARQSFQTVPSRVAGVLSQLIAEEAIPEERRGITIRMTQADLAQLAGHLARERQPLPRDARARRRRRGRPRPGDGARAAPAARLHLLSVEPTDLAASASGWSSASCAGAGSPTSGCSRRWRRCRASASSPERLARRAYADSALPIGDGQTISQPWIVAAICQALELRGGERVLEIGTGSGYSAAILALLAGEVISDRARSGARGRRARALAELDLPGSGTSRSGSATGASGLPDRRAVRRDRGPRPGAGAAARRCSSSSPSGGRLVVPLAEPAGRHADRVHAPSADAGVEGPRRSRRAVRAADRERGLRASRSM